MNILQPVNQSKRQFIIIGLITVLLIMACFTTACLQPKPSDEVPKLEFTPEPTPPAESTPTPAPPSEEVPQKEDALAYGPYWGGVFSTRMIGKDEGPYIDMIIDIPVKKEPLYDYFPVLDVKYNKIDTETVKEIADYLLGDNYTSNETSSNEYFSASSADGGFGLSFWYDTNEYSHLKYFSEDYYYEPVMLLERGLKSTYDYIAESSIAYDFVRTVSRDYVTNQKFLGKVIPKDMTNLDEIDLDELEDCIIVRYSPIYRFNYDWMDGVMFYEPATVVMSTEERIDKIESAIYDPSNPLSAEYIEVVIKDNEIVGVTLNGYSEVTNITEHDSIITYDAAYEIFEKKILRSSFWESDISSYYNVIITDIKFGLVRAGNQMVPAYTFIGIQRSIASGVETVDYEKTDVAAFMIINALDGSIVDMD